MTLKRQALNLSVIFAKFLKVCFNCHFFFPSYTESKLHRLCFFNTILNLDLHIMFWLTPILSTSPLRISWILSSP